MVLDDVHNAGLATVELLHYLARNLTGTRLLLLGTIRAEEGEDALESLADVTERLDLGPCCTIGPTGPTGGGPCWPCTV